MRRYAYSYTAAHDFTLLPELMAEDYVLRMGEHVVRGRDTAYRQATQRQYDQFPGLGFTVHDVVFNGDRTALAFSEHGASRFRAGAQASWSGVSLYRWDGVRLVECLVEQDYWARRRQLNRRAPDPVAPPAHDPWSVAAVPEDPAAVGRVRGWLAEYGIGSSPYGSVDDESAGAAQERVVLAGPRTQILDIFSAGPTVAFACRISGVYDGGPAELDHHRGRPAVLYATGIAVVDDDVPAGVRLRHAVTDRLGLAKRLGA